MLYDRQRVSAGQRKEGRVRESASGGIWGGSYKCIAAAVLGFERVRAPFLRRAHAFVVCPRLRMRVRLRCAIVWHDVRGVPFVCVWRPR